MTLYAIIEKSTNTVVNTTVWDGVSNWHPGNKYILIQSDTAGIGQIWDGTTFSNPVVPEPPITNPI